MKTIATIVLLSAFGIGAAAAAPATTGDLKTSLTNDRPLAGPYSRAAGWPSINSWGPAQVSDTSFFYAPGMGPRCDFVRFRRVDGRLTRSCE